MIQTTAAVLQIEFDNDDGRYWIGDIEKATFPDKVYQLPHH